ncbi:MAG: hypothetical protein LBR10_15015 [Prevotellaceae bacterium]|nr:hypothetical protein [Prevotellaceae bacterium]
MKRIVLIIIINLLLLGIVNAQPTMDKTTFDRLVDYVNTELTKAYLNDFFTKNSNTPYSDGFHKDSIHYTDNIKQRLLLNTISKPVGFERLSNLLGSQFIRTLKNVSEPVNNRKNFYNDTVSNMDLLTLIVDNKDLSPKNRKMLEECTQSVKFELISYYAIKEQKTRTETVRIIKEDILKIIKEENQSATEKIRKSNLLFNVCVSMMLIVLPCICGYLLYMMYKQKKLIEKIINYKNEK